MTNDKKTNGKFNNNRPQRQELQGYTIPLYDGGVCNGREYDVKSLVEIMEKLVDVVSKVSIPVYMNRSDIFKDRPEIRGQVQVGYISAINITNDSAVDIDIKVFHKFTDNVSEMKYSVIYPRCRVLKGEVANIIGLDISDATRYIND